MKYQNKVIARPETWEQDMREEADFEAAETVRLLYVAATRARDELWVAQGSGLKGAAATALWDPITEWARAQNAGWATREEPAPKERTAPDALDPDTDFAGRVEQVEAALTRAGGPTYELATVSGLAKDSAKTAGQDVSPIETFPSSPLLPVSGGYEWGSVVHQMLAAAGDGNNEQALAQLARDQLIESERPVDVRGEPVELEALLALVAAVRKSQVWARAMASEERYTEMPFALHRRAAGGPPGVLEGVIDLVFREGDGWGGGRLQDRHRR